MKKYIQTTLFSVLLLSSGLLAAEQPTIHFQVTEDAWVESDLLEVMVNIQYKDQDSGAVAAQVNKVAAQIVALAQSMEGVTVSSEGYQTWSQPYGKKSMGRIEWVVRQTLMMKTADFQPLLARLGELQQLGGQVQSLNYTLSPTRKRAVEEQLKTEAIARFRVQAAAYAQAAGVGADQWALLTLQVGQPAGSAPVMPMARGMFAMESNPGISAPPGREQISATVSGAIVLKQGQGEIKEKIQDLTGTVVERLQSSVEKGLESIKDAPHSGEDE